MSDLERGGWLVSGEERPKKSGVDFGVEDCKALPVVGEDVGVGMGQPDDQPFQAESAEVVAAAGLAVGLAEQSGDQRSEGAVGDAADQVGGDGEGAGQGHEGTDREPEMLRRLAREISDRMGAFVLTIGLEEGRIVQRGTHAELLRRGGLYADLYRTQFGRAPAGPPADGRAVSRAATA